MFCNASLPKKDPLLILTSSLNLLDGGFKPGLIGVIEWIGVLPMERRLLKFWFSPQFCGLSLIFIICSISFSCWCSWFVIFARLIDSLR